MSEAASKPPRMSVDEFIAWSADKPGRHEFYHGEVVRMQSERRSHNLVKLATAIALREALRRAGISCTTFTDGITVRVDAEAVFEPDVTVDCARTDKDSIYAEMPVIVVEVISPSTSRIDSGLKFASYFQLPSVRHYLIVNAQSRVIIHHRREGAEIRATILPARHSEPLHLDPPGITVQVADFFADLPPPSEDA